jgi:hypothetical protein
MLHSHAIGRKLKIKETYCRCPSLFESRPERAPKREPVYKQPMPVTQDAYRLMFHKCKIDIGKAPVTQNVPATRRSALSSPVIADRTGVEAKTSVVSGSWRRSAVETTHKAVLCG